MQNHARRASLSLLLLALLPLKAQQAPQSATALCVSVVSFELLFPAAALGLGVVDIPVRYLARTYGETNIRRFRHGLLLLKMTWVGFIRIKMGVTRKFETAGN